MGAGDLMPSGGGNHRKKRLTAKERKRILAAYKTVGPIIDRNQKAQEEEASRAEDLLADFIQDNTHHAENKNHQHLGASDGQRRADSPTG